MNQAEVTRLQFLLSHVRTLSDQHWHTFTASRRAMDDRAWVGGTSPRAFAAKLERNDAALRAALQKALRLVEDELRRA
ncbi:hypothetical protein [Actinomadura terrae]|uniref:hypothetical protein n=1 Tax=Actinomadura terrae TaxID=604353 RepID=UPI001FA7D3BA|nr:hypothetical protein [Actinomadura terrae]